MADPLIDLERPERPFAAAALASLMASPAGGSAIPQRLRTQVLEPTFRTSRDAFLGISPPANTFLLSDLRQS